MLDGRKYETLQTNFVTNYEAQTASATSTKHLVPLSTSDARSTDQLHFCVVGQLLVFHYDNNNARKCGRSQYH